MSRCGFAVAGQVRELADRSHDAGLRGVAHAHSQVAVRHALAAEVDGLEHFTCLTDQGPQTPDELVAEVAARGVTVCPTLGTGPDRVPPLELAPPAIQELVARLGIQPDDIFVLRAEQLDRLRRAGVSVISRQDSGAMPAQAARRAVPLRLGPGLLRLGGRRRARHRHVGRRPGLRAGRHAGCLRVGLAADLLVVGGDLEPDVSALARPVRVLVRGVPF